MSIQLNSFLSIHSVVQHYVLGIQHRIQPTWNCEYLWDRQAIHGEQCKYNTSIFLVVAMFLFLVLFLMEPPPATNAHPGLNGRWLSNHIPHSCSIGLMCLSSLAKKKPKLLCQTSKGLPCGKNITGGLWVQTATIRVHGLKLPGRVWFL